MANPVISELELRVFAKDIPELNPLLNGTRFSSQEIEQAIINTVDRFNLILPPSINYTQENFPSRSLLMMGVWGWLLMGASIQQASNELNYSADGVSIDDNNKAQIFSALGDKYWNEFKDAARDLKLSISINSIYQSRASEYTYRPW